MQVLQLKAESQAKGIATTWVMNLGQAVDLEKDCFL